jgi:tetratricopeptide (TPR) repeat protein
VARIALALLATGACLLLMREAARIGFSRLLTRYALTTNSLPAADQAVQLTPSDPEAHRARALILNRLRRPAEAVAALEIATSLRDGPEDLWIELASTKEELGDRDGALRALDRAVRAAPYYAHTHWQRGNLLLRMDRYDEGFAELREAASRNRKYFPSLLDLAWGLTANAEKTEAFVQFRDDEDRLAFARLLARKGKGTEVVDQVRLLATPLSDENRDELTRLLSASNSSTGFAGFWAENKKVEEIANSSFEEAVFLNGSMSGWTLPRARTNPVVALDVSEKLSGQRSLQVSFEGEWEPGAQLLSQTIVVRRGASYRLGFGIKTKDLVTGGPLRIVLTDATDNQILAKSNAFPSTTGAWQEWSVDFKALSETVVISLVRDNCTSSPCPIFGVVWLDDFSLQKL